MCDRLPVGPTGLPTTTWLLGLVAAPLFLHQGCRGEVRGNRDAIGAQHRFSDLHRPAGVDLTIDKPTSGMLDATEVVPDRRRINVIGAAGSLNDPKRAWARRTVPRICTPLPDRSTAS